MDESFVVLPSTTTVNRGGAAAALAPGAPGAPPDAPASKESPEALIAR